MNDTLTITVTRDLDGHLRATLCAWCEKELGLRAPLNPEVRVSHGICARHKAELEARWLERALVAGRHGLAEQSSS
jgi:hypothetical protein